MDIKIVDFNVNMEDVKLANITSLLVDSPTCLASIDFIVNDKKETMELMVYGEKKIYYKEYCYRYVDEYSKELLKLLNTKDPNSYYIWLDNGVDILDNNWVELTYTKDGQIQPDGYVCDGEFGETEEEIKEFFFDMIKEFYGD